MATSLQAQIIASVRTALFSGVAGAHGSQGFQIERKINLTNGITVGKGDKIYAAQRTLAGSAAEVLDLAGVLTDPLGATLTFVNIKFIMVSNTNGTDGDDLDVGADATQGWIGMTSPAIGRLRGAADGFFMWWDPNGLAVGAGATDELEVDNQSANEVIYDVVIIGSSA